MKSNYKRLGDYIRQVDIRNSANELGEKDLFGVSVNKEYIETHANLVGVSFENYKVVENNQFTYIPDTSRRGDKIALALNTFNKKIIVSNVYTVFEIIKPEELDANYLMLLFKNPEFDRYARYNSWGSAREVFSWEELCNTELEIPDIKEQKKIVLNNKTLENRLNALLQTANSLSNEAAAIVKQIINSCCTKTNIYNVCKSITYGKGLSTDNLKKSGYKVYGGNGVIGFYDTFLYKEPQILISCRGAASGKVVISEEESYVTSNSLILELNNYELFNFYKYYFLNNEFYEYVTGSAQPQLTVDNLSNAEIVNISKDKCIKEIETLNVISKFETIIKKEIEILTRMQNAYIGEI